ncbi:MAG: hypothetical protein JKY22_12330 [Flavobacteriaceae bacterium]|nr:hypothetical protein [Flavobacteriaceae bacterium]
MKYIFLLLFTQSIFAANVSEYTASGAIQNIGGTDFSGLEWGVTTDGIEGEFRVDNKTGILTYPGGSCGIGGDLEAITMGEDGSFYAVNEAKHGISAFNVHSINGCTAPRRFLMNGGGTNIEGITYKDGILYTLNENDGSIYWFIDSGGTAFPQLLFTIPNCPGAGDLAFNGDNIVAICDGIPLVVEYDLDGNFIAENNYFGINNAEAIYFNDNQMCLGGEPDEYLCFTAGDPIDPPPPTLVENCTFSGNIDVDEFGNFTAQTVNFICPTIIASGTLN